MIKPIIFTFLSFVVSTRFVDCQTFQNANNSKCLVVDSDKLENFMLELESFKLKIDDGKPIEIDYKNEIGQCQRTNSTEQIFRLTKDDSQNDYLEFKFELNKDNTTYYLYNVSFTSYKQTTMSNVTQYEYAYNSIDPNLRLTSNTFKTNKNGYKCDSIEIELSPIFPNLQKNKTSKVILEMKKLKFAAFINGTNKDFDPSYVECRDEPTGGAIPIVVGGILFVLMAALLVIYIIARNRSS